MMIIVQNAIMRDFAGTADSYNYEEIGDRYGVRYRFGNMNHLVYSYHKSSFDRFAGTFGSGPRTSMNTTGNVISIDLNISFETISNIFKMSSNNSTN
jgi:hypothetical protein